jgi:hypothetical protein
MNAASVALAPDHRHRRDFRCFGHRQPSLCALARAAGSLIDKTENPWSRIIGARFLG